MRNIIISSWTITFNWLKIWLILKFLISELFHSWVLFLFATMESSVITWNKTVHNLECVTNKLCSFVACTIMHLCMGNSTAYFTTNNCSKERGITMRDLDMLNTRTDGFSGILLTEHPMSQRHEYWLSVSTTSPYLSILPCHITMWFDEAVLFLSSADGGCDIMDNLHEDMLICPLLSRSHSVFRYRVVVNEKVLKNIIMTFCYCNHGVIINMLTHVDHNVFSVA